MKKFHLDILFFLLIALVFYPVLLFVYGVFVPEKLLNSNLVSRRISTGFTSKRISEGANYGKVDVVFMGSSHCNRGFDPRAFAKNGIRTFTLGSSSQTPAQYRALLNNFLPILQPRLVVFEMFPLCFTMDGVESSIDFISNNFFPADFVPPVLEQNNMKVYNTLAFFSMADILGFDPDVRKPDPDDHYVSGGFVERKVYCNSPGTKQTEYWRTNPFQISAFRECLQLVREAGCDILLVYAPVSPSFYNGYLNQDSLAAALTHGFDYIDFNKRMSLDDSLYFYDGHHLNQRGVEEFSKLIVPVIEDRLRSKPKN